MKKIASLISFVSFALTISFPYSALAFSDVKTSDPYYEAVESLKKDGFIEDNKFFFPSAYIKKAEFEKLAWNIAGYKSKKNEKAITKFRDVPADSWFAPYVKKALLTKILNFDEKNPYYLPEKTVTRAEALEFIFETQGIGITKVFQKKDIPFKDVAAMSPYAPIAKTALELKLFTNEKKFEPLKKITRAEAASYLHKIKNIYTSGNLKSAELPTVIIKLDTQPSNSANGDTFTTNDQFPILIDVWKKVHQRFAYKEKIDDKKLMYGAISGMVGKLEDPYTVFQEPVAASSFNDALSGEFEGIGVSIDMINEQVTVISPIRNSPAEKAGLRPNDIITKADGKNLKGLTLEQVALLIKGPKGTSVTLTILRDKKEINLTVTREKIKITAVEGYMKNGVAVIEILSFNQDIDIDFKKIANDLIKQNPKGFIIDLRNNPGGFLDAALRISDQFLANGTTISSLTFTSSQSALETFNEAKNEPERVRMPQSTEVQYMSRGPGELGAYKIAILQNKGSASASEILAAALRDNGKATIYGDVSFGKGSVQELATYSDGSQFKISIAKWLTPKGINLTKNPITPDVMVKDDYDKEGDETLNKALEQF